MDKGKPRQGDLTPWVHDLLIPILALEDALEACNFHDAAFFNEFSSLDSAALSQDLFNKIVSGTYRCRINKINIQGKEPVSDIF